MIRIIVLIIFCLTFMKVVFSQSSELIYQNGVWQESKKMTATEVRALLSYNSDALSLYNNGKVMEIAGYIISVPCAFLFGYDIGGRLAGADGNNTMLIVGAAGTIGGLLIGYWGERKIKRSVQLYNANLNKVSYQINFGLTQTGGIGFTFNF